MEIGHLQTEINLTLKSPFESVILILHRNSNLCGKLSENYNRWEMHGLKSCFLHTNLNIKYAPKWFSDFIYVQPNPNKPPNHAHTSMWHYSLLSDYQVSQTGIFQANLVTTTMGTQLRELAT